MSGPDEGRGADAPAQLGKYVIEAVLGRGGMGVVYKARDPRMDRLVAIKTLTDNFTEDGGALKRFLREAEKTGRLKHPNIITIYDLGEEDGHPYIVMEFVEGRALDSIIKAQSELHILHKLRIIEQVSMALGYAHANDVVHRDVKPANVIVRPDGVTKLLDFGIAVQEKRVGDLTLTKTGTIIGTVPYMAPERLLGGVVDGRADIFATGVMLFQLLTGELPFAGEEMVLITKLLNDQHPRLSTYLQEYPRELDRILDSSLAKSPNDRYPTAEEMAADIFAVIEIVKKQYIAELLRQANQHLGADDPMPARELFIEALKLDNQQTQARRMLGEVNQQISRKQHVEHAAQKRHQAEQAVLERNYEVAIPLLQEASKLLPEDESLAERLEAVRQKKLVNDQVARYLQQANEAKQNGNLSAARAMVQQALEIDEKNSRVRSVYNALLRQAKEAEQRSEARKLLQKAREEIAAAHYDEAFSLVRDAEALDPSSGEVQSVLSAAQEGFKRAMRRTVLDEVEKLIALATGEEESRRAVAAVEAALERLPSDPVLVRYKLQMDQQVRDLSKRRVVDGMVQQCRSLGETAPEEALAQVRSALVQYPGEERLLALARTLEEQIARQEEETTRSAYLLQARDALSALDFAAAIEILERCQQHCFSQEVGELLQFARESEAQRRRGQTVAACQARARTLLDDGEYETLIAEVSAVLREGQDENLQRMFEQAQSRLEKSRLGREAAVLNMRGIAERGFHEQVLLAAGTMPVEFLASPEMVAITTREEQAWRGELLELQKIGRGFGSLATEHPVADWTDGNTSPGSGEQEKPAAALWKELSTLRLTTADENIREGMEKLSALPSLSGADAVACVRKGNEFAPFATSKREKEWTKALHRTAWKGFAKAIALRPASRFGGSHSSR